MTLRPLPLLAGLALALWLLVRRRRLGRAAILGGGLAAGALIALGLGLIPVPDVEGILLDLGRALGRWTYALVGALAFLETGAFVGLLVPGETTVVVGGVIAGQGRIDVVVLIGVVWACAVAGDLTSYAIGRRLGRGFLERHGHRMRITPERLAHVDDFFERRGGATILVGRFLGLVRALAPFLAGASRMPLRTFVPYDVLGAGAWSATFVLLGYVFWRSLDRAVDWAGRGLFALGAALALAGGAWFAHRLARDPRLRRRTREWGARQFRRPWLRPAGRLLAPVWRGVLAPLLRAAAGPVRFLGDRLTPGDLGLELTTLGALVAAGGFGFVALGLQADQHARLPGDAEAADAAEALRGDLPVEAVSVLTDLGAFPPALLLVVATGYWAFRRGRRAEAAALVGGFLLTMLVVHLGKTGWERPRPVDPLASARGYAYPSGHAAYATAWVACAVVLVRAGFGPATRFAAVGAGVAVLVFVAFSRVYLRVHHLTDVVGGAAAGLAVFALCGAAALVADRSRR